MKNSEDVRTFNGKTSFSHLRDSVLYWLSKMQVTITQFRMGDEMDATIFSSCFALFIKDLFGVTDTWGESKRNAWIDYINSFQDENTGYFIPERHQGDLNTKPVQQLTAFCLSALEIFGALPQYELKFINQWQTKDDVGNYLKANGCFTGQPTSGNRAMFLAIFLTYHYEKTGDDRFLDLMNTWFQLHDESQNSQTGFWGNSEKEDPYSGFQNALHQFVIYNYWNKTIQYNQQIIDNVLKLQAPDGFFAPYPGGSSCYDYDAADILIHCGIKKSYRKSDVEKSLLHLAAGIWENQNEDGGFCESRKRPASIFNVLSPDALKFVVSSSDVNIAFYKLKTTLKMSLKRNRFIYNHWTKSGRYWNQSNMWDTWFRCLTIAEISQTLSSNSNDKNHFFGFLKTVGLGYFNCNCSVPATQNLPI